MSQKKIKVAICMITYNHEEFISKAIEGVLMQETDFDFKLFITNDKSPDNTDLICKKYAEDNTNLIEYECLSKNKGSMFNWLYTLKKCQNSEAKYIAMCDGDDYWTDIHKLQMQVDFLDKNPDYGLVHTDSNNLINKTGDFFPRNNKDIHVPENITTDLLLRENLIKTLTVVFKNDLEDLFSYKIFPNIKNYKLGDYPIWIIISMKYKIGYIDKATATYRALEMSASMHGNDHKKRFNFLFSVLTMKYDYIEKFGCSNETKEIVNQQYYNLKFDYALYKKDYIAAKKFHNLLKNKNLKQKVKIWSIKNNLNFTIGNILLKIFKRIKG